MTGMVLLISLAHSQRFLALLLFVGGRIAPLTNSDLSRMPS